MKEQHSKDNRDYWKGEEEQIIKQWADKALCYQWMHARCRQIYKKKNAWYTIPVIIISTITGTANFAQDRFSEDIKQYVVMGIGSMSIIAGIVTTIYQFLQIAELNEGHRAASISWTKLHNNLKTLITRHPLDRIPPSHALKLYKDEYEYLTEISPPIVKTVLNQFNTKFKKSANLTKPEICSKLEPTSIFKMNEQERNLMINKINNVKKNPKLIDTFFNINGRDATEDEIETLQNNIDLEINDIEGLNNNENIIENNDEPIGESDSINQSNNRTTDI